MIIDSVNDAGTRHTGDFQITPDGNDGAFTTTIPLTGYTNAGHEEVFRYDSPSDAIDCASCNPTGARATGEASLARNGLSLTEDGRVFFNSTDPLVPSDLDNREDVYEWSEGEDKPDLDRPQPVQLEPAERQRRRHGRLLLHPRHAGAPGPERKPGQDLRRPRKRRLRLHTAAGELQSLRRVPRRRQPGADAAGGRHDHRHRRQPHRRAARNAATGKVRRQRPLREEARRDITASIDTERSGRAAEAGEDRDDRRDIEHAPRLRVSLGLALLLIAISSVGTAQATEGIESFATETSTTAGRRPSRPAHDLHPQKPGPARGGRERVRRNAFGDLRQPERGRTSAPRSYFAQQECPPTSQVGPDHRPRPLRRQLQLPAGHRADLQHRTLRSGDGAVRVHRSDPEHPDPDPGRRADRQRLRTELQGLRDHPGDAARGRRPHLLGLPGGQRPRGPALPEGDDRPALGLRRAWPTRAASRNRRRSESRCTR